MDLKDLSQQNPLVTTTQTEVTALHQCRRSGGKHRWLQLASEWHLLFSYLLFSLVFAFGMRYWLHGRSFALSGSSLRPNSTFKLAQPDVVTIISACLVAGRALGTAWQALAAWRCIFILFEKAGLSLADASIIGSWKLPAWSIVRPQSSSRPGGHASKFIAMLALLLAWPAQLASPLATGSISWVPIESYDIDSTKSILLGTPMAGREWEAYAVGYNIRQGLILTSAGMASLKATAPYNFNNGSLPVTPARRMATFLSSYANGTLIRNATVPFFNIESFEWITDESQIPTGILASIQHARSGYLNISKSETGMTNAIRGTTALLKDRPWEAPSTKVLPEPVSHLSVVKYAAVYVTSGPGTHEHICDPSDEATIFSPLPLGIHLVKRLQVNDRSDCLAVAKLQISAGVTECGQSEPTSNMTCFLASNIIISNSSQVLADPLTDEVFAMMPEVHAIAGSLQMEDPASLKGKMERYLRNSLVQTYQGTWSTLTDFVSNNSNTDNKLKTIGWEPEQLLQAQVSSHRILLWLGMSLMLVFSGLLVLVIDWTSEGKTVNNPVIAALMLDNSEVIRADNTGLCNAVDTGKGQGNTHMKLRLEISSRSTVLDGYYHPRLVPEGHVRSVL